MCTIYQTGETAMEKNDFFGTESIGRILLKIAPPVMLAQLIQALYNIVDSFFVGKYSADALTALTVIYPLQLIIIALAVGTGVGVNTYMARKYAQNRPKAAQGAAGAAYATVAGQFVAAAVTSGAFCKSPKFSEFKHYTKRIYFFGYSSIVMQLLFTVYIVMLNVILAKFSDAAVTVLGLYYKAQSFFFIPLIGLETCIVPVLSYNYARAEYGRCRSVMKYSFIISLLFMLVGIFFFEFMPETLMRLFSASDEVMIIGKIAFPIIGASFIPAVFSLMTPVFFQAIGKGGQSLLLSLTRQIFVLVPVFWAMSKIGLNYTWTAFPAAELSAGILGLILYAHRIAKWKQK